MAPLSAMLKICLTFGAVALPLKNSSNVEKLSKLTLGCFHQQNSDGVKVRTQVFRDDFEPKCHNICKSLKNVKYIKEFEYAWALRDYPRRIQLR